MNVESLPQEEDNQALAALIKPLSRDLHPSQEFVYWTRRMLLNVMKLPSFDATELEPETATREAA